MSSGYGVSQTHFVTLELIRCRMTQILFFSECLQIIHIFLIMTKVISLLNFFCSARENIFLSIKSQPGMLPLDELAWYLDEIKSKQGAARKALLYVR